MYYKKCERFWLESDYLPIAAVLEYWCEDKVECRKAKEYAIIAACERGEIDYERSDNITFNVPIKELIGKGVLLLHRESFEKWAKKFDDGVKFDLSKAKQNNHIHPYHASILEISNQCWCELWHSRLEEDGKPTGGAREYIYNWLKTKYPKLSGAVKDAIVLSVNPDCFKKGGATPTDF